jgi:flagellar basal body-associated protein FliL
MASSKATTSTKLSKPEAKKEQKGNLRINKSTQQNITFGLLLIGLLVAGFSFGAVIGLVDDASKSQTTTYTREAKANYVAPTPSTTPIPAIPTNTNSGSSSSDTAAYSIQVLPLTPGN